MVKIYISTARGKGLLPSWGTKISHAAGCRKNKNKAFTTVTSGLKEETSIIRYPNENTTDGMEVQINEEINEENNPESDGIVIS